MPPGISKVEQSERTRRALLDAARALFAEHGYADTSTEEVVRRTAVTSGALYYHFHDKAGLFKAVYEEQRAALVQSICERVQVAEGDMWQRVVVATCHAFIERAADSSVRRIFYLDAPAVLGRPTQRTGPGFDLIQQTLEPLMAEGLLDPLPLDPLTHLAWATCFEAGLYVAYADDTLQAQEEMLTMLLRFLDGLRPRP